MKHYKQDVSQYLKLVPPLYSRFKEIERSIPKLSSKVLAKELKDIETHLLIQRKVDEETSLIYYTLTPYAETLREVMLALRKWGKGHREMVIANF